MRQDHFTTIYLEKAFFSEKERILAENSRLSASVFLYGSGVHGLRIKNKRGKITVLPFQGQQIWECIFDDRNLTMKSMFKEPEATQSFTHNYGGFLLHCGASAMGNPSKEDIHPVHGELPNAAYQKAFLRCGCDKGGCYMAFGGQYEYIEAFRHHYIAEPLVKMYENSTVMDISMSITNLRNSSMELMYLMHINFMLKNGSKLIYSAGSMPEDIIVHINPSDIEKSPEKGEFTSFLNNLERDPGLHNHILPNQPYDPEIVFTIDYKYDDEGRAYSMQVHPDGYADYVCHRPGELDHGIRWIARTCDENAIGLLLPATADHKGYLAEKSKGNIKILSTGEKAEYHVNAGLLAPKEVEMVKKRIEKIMITKAQV